MICSACGDDLGDSQNVLGGSGEVEWKSCPECSRRGGIHVFYRFEEFGFREMKGRPHVQSWCPRCRSKQPATDYAFLCSDAD